MTHMELARKTRKKADKARKKQNNERARIARKSSPKLKSRLVPDGTGNGTFKFIHY